MSSPFVFLPRGLDWCNDCRIVVLVLSLALILAGCGRSGNELPTDPQALGRPVAGADVHDLVVPVDQVTGMPGWVGLHSGEVLKVPRLDPV